MTSKLDGKDPRDPKGKKKYVKPELKRMNEKVVKAVGSPAVQGPAVSAPASPTAPGTKVF
ncbi:MAG: hypothetical protein V1495_09925 [Pseudomonadota bacterium]